MRRSKFLKILGGLTLLPSIAFSSIDDGWKDCTHTPMDSGGVIQFFPTVMKLHDPHTFEPVGEIIYDKFKDGKIKTKTIWY